jgi:hypothetical protein
MLEITLLTTYQFKPKILQLAMLFYVAKRNLIMIGEM